MSIEDLLVEAASDGEVDKRTTAVLLNANTVRQVAKGSGVTADEYRESEALLVTVMVDDSGSIFGESASGTNNAPAIIEGYNGLLEALLGAKQKGRILVSCRYLNGTILCPYTYLEQAPKMSASNFFSGGGTPLYDQSVVLFGAVMAKAREFEDKGVGVRTWTLLISDGADYGSRSATAQNVAALAATLTSEAHMVLALGVNDGATDFKDVFQKMGVREERILVSANDPKAIRKTLRLASQSAAAFNEPVAAGSSGAMLGGFAG